MLERGHPQILLRDPISEATRKEWRSLLGISTTGFAIVKTGLVPSKISTLGVEFSTADKSILLWIVTGVTFYFLLAFLIYALSDFLVWRLAYRSAVREQALAELELFERTEGKKKSPQFFEELTEGVIRRMKLDDSLPAAFAISLAKPMSIFRAVFEFAFPVGFALYAIWILRFNSLITDWFTGLRAG